MLNLALPWWEFVVRGLVIYVFLIAALRLTGKRQIGQMAPFDLVLLLILSNAVQNSMNGGDNSLVGGMISAATLLLLNAFVSRLTFRSKRISNLVEGHPEVLVHNGIVNQTILDRENLSHHELNGAIRSAGCASLSEVRFAVLENDGAISVLPRKK